MELREREGGGESLKDETREEGERFQLSNEDIENILGSSEEQPVEFQGASGERGPEGSQGPPGPPGPEGEVPKWVKITSILAFLIGVLSLYIALLGASDINNLELQIKDLLKMVEERKDETGEVRRTVEQLEKELKENSNEVKQLRRTIEQLEKELEENSNTTTTYERVNTFLREFQGWKAEDMAVKLEAEFQEVETKLIEQDGIRYLFLRFRDSPTTEWWWVTWQGLKDIAECPLSHTQNKK